MPLEPFGVDPVPIQEVPETYQRIMVAHVPWIALGGVLLITSCSLFGLAQSLAWAPWIYWILFGFLGFSLVFLAFVLNSGFSALSGVSEIVAQFRLNQEHRRDIELNLTNLQINMNIVANQVDVGGVGNQAEQFLKIGHAGREYLLDMESGNMIPPRLLTVPPSQRLLPEPEESPQEREAGYTLSWQDVDAFIDLMLLRGFTKSSLWGKRLPSGRTIYHPLYKAVMDSIAPAFENRRERAKGTLTIADAESLKKIARLSCPEGVRVLPPQKKTEGAG